MIYKMGFVGSCAHDDAWAFVKKAKERFGDVAVHSISSKTVEANGRELPAYEVELNPAVIISSPSFALGELEDCWDALRVMCIQIRNGISKLRSTVRAILAQRRWTLETAKKLAEQARRYEHPNP